MTTEQRKKPTMRLLKANPFKWGKKRVKTERTGEREKEGERGSYKKNQKRQSCNYLADEKRIQQQDLIQEYLFAQE